MGITIKKDKLFVIDNVIEILEKERTAAIVEEFNVWKEEKEKEYLDEVKEYETRSRLGKILSEKPDKIKYPKSETDQLKYIKEFYSLNGEIKRYREISEIIEMINDIHFKRAELLLSGESELNWRELEIVYKLYLNKLSQEDVEKLLKEA